ncbi:MFS transporter [Streptomyces sp. R35]|uniref:MFS transporter n=1 Tax=Streptomyces sp. R35 TaxID=3238630 RepID=A0AB39SLM4_9ACTN
MTSPRMSGAQHLSPDRPSHTFRSVFPVLALCWMAVFFDGMDVNIYGAVMPHVLDDSGLGLTPASAGTIGSWTTFGMLIGALPTGNITDWLGRRPMLVASVTLFSVGSAICASAGDPTLFGAAGSSPVSGSAV